MTQVYRLPDYSHLVTDLHQSKRHSDTTARGVSKRQKVCDFVTDAAGGATMDDSRQELGAFAENTGDILNETLLLVCLLVDPETRIRQ
jgi:hypothetical protein